MIIFVKWSIKIYINAQNIQNYGVNGPNTLESIHGNVCYILYHWYNVKTLGKIVGICLIINIYF